MVAAYQAIQMPLTRVRIKTDSSGLRVAGRHCGLPATSQAYVTVYPSESPSQRNREMPGCDCPFHKFSAVEYFFELTSSLPVDMLCIEK
jgi:hypothetical protein